MSDLETKRNKYAYLQAVLKACNAQFESASDIQCKIFNDFVPDRNIGEQIVSAYWSMESAGLRAQLDFLPIIASKMQRLAVLAHGDLLAAEWNELKAKLQEDGITDEQAQGIKAQMQQCQAAVSVYYDAINVDLIDPAMADYAAFATKAARAIYDRMHYSLLELI